MEVDNRVRLAMWKYIALRQEADDAISGETPSKKDPLDDDDGGDGTAPALPFPIPQP